MIISHVLTGHYLKLESYGDDCKTRDENSNHYNFLDKFEYLTQAKLTSKSIAATDIKNSIEILAKKNQLSGLTIYLELDDLKGLSNNDPEFKYSNGFSSLESICFCFPHLWEIYYIIYANRFTKI